MSSLSADLTPVEVFSKTIEEIARFIGVNKTYGELTFTGVTLNSRNAKNGDLFIALSGAKVHGATFADQAISQGAIAVITDEAGSNLIHAEVPVLVVGNPRF